MLRVQLTNLHYMKLFGKFQTFVTIFDILFWQTLDLIYQYLNFFLVWPLLLTFHECP